MCDDDTCLQDGHQRLFVLAGAWALYAWFEVLRLRFPDTFGVVFWAVNKGLLRTSERDRVTGEIDGEHRNNEHFCVWKSHVLVLCECCSSLVCTRSLFLCYSYVCHESNDSQLFFAIFEFLINNNVPASSSSEYLTAPLRAGTFTFLSGLLITCLFFPPFISHLALLFLSVADPAAALVGSQMRISPWRFPSGKSLHGTLTAAACCHVLARMMMTHVSSDVVPVPVKASLVVSSNVHGRHCRRRHACMHAL